MARFHYILFPVDFSERCSNFIPQVASVAQHSNAKLTLLHGLQTVPAWFGGGEMSCPVGFAYNYTWADAADRLATFRGDFVRRLAVIPEAVIEEGDPATLIREYAEKNGVDLIMMPTHGCGTFRRFLLGSVTAKVLHDSRCAVWTAADDNPAPDPAQIQCDSILWAVNLKPASTSLISYAQAVAKEFRSQLRLVHAVTGADDGGIDCGIEFADSCLRQPARNWRVYNPLRALILRSVLTPVRSPG